MKTMITFLLLFVSVLSYGQSEKYFNYKISKFSRSDVDSNYLVTPKFEVMPFDKADEGLIISRASTGEYFRKFVNNVTLAVLKDTVEMLTPRLGKSDETSRAKVGLYIDEEGNIRYVDFFIKKNDKKYLSDTLLYELYQKFKVTKFDMSTVVFESKDGRAHTGKYFTLILPLYTKIFCNKTL